MVYIAYEYPGLVVCFDPVHNKVRWQRELTDSVTDVQVDSTSHRVYATTSMFRQNKGQLSVFDGASGKVLLTASIGFGDNGIALDLKRQRVYVSSSDSGIINVFSLVTSATGQLSAVPSTLAIGAHPQALGINSRLGRLYVGDGSANIITVYDLVHDSILDVIQVAAQPTQPLRVDESSGRV